MQSQGAAHSVRAMCRALAVSPSGYYEWRSRGPSTRAAENERLGCLIEQVHVECRQAYGTERLWRELRARGESCGRHRVARLRRHSGVLTRRRQRYLRRRGPYARDPDAGRHVTWPFTSSGPNRIWMADITLIPTAQGWLYLATVLDLWSRRVVGWSMSHRMTQDLADDALRMAVEQRRPRPGLIHHSDRGSQYTSKTYRAHLDAIGAIASTSRVAMPYDNAVVESFFSSLKNELTHHERFMSNDQARGRLFDYIEVFYNRQRRHKALGYIAPVEFERLAAVA